MYLLGVGERNEWKKERVTNDKLRIFGLYLPPRMKKESTRNHTIKINSIFDHRETAYASPKRHVVFYFLACFLIKNIILMINYDTSHAIQQLTKKKIETKEFDTLGLNALNFLDLRVYL